MVLVHYNQQIFPVEQFILDTEDTLFNRIVWAIGSVPQYVWIPDPDILTTPTVFPVVLPLLVKSASDFSLFFQEFESRFSPRDIVWQWKLQHPEDFYVLSFQPDFQSRFADTIFEIQSGVEYQQEIDKQFHSFNFKQQEMLSQLNGIQQLEPYLMTFTQNPHVQLNYLIQTGYSSLESVFNRLETSRWIPVITFNGYFKIISHFVPKVNWLSPVDKIIGKMALDGEGREEWMDISISKGEVDRQFIISFKTHPGLPAPAETILQHLVRHLGGFQIVNVKDINAGSTLECDIPMKNYIFSDLVLSKNVLRQYISVNDNVQFKSEFASRHVYITLNETHSVSMSMSIQPDSGTKFKIIQTSSNRMIQVASDLLARIVQLYREEATEIQIIYSYFIPSLKTEEKSTQIVDSQPEKKRFFKDRIPAIFVSKGTEIYSRRCQSNKQPTILSESEAQEEKNQVIRFPKESDSHIATPQFYTCLDSTYSHIGLIPFNNELGVAPCCFKTSQVNKPIFKSYFSDSNAVRPTPDQPQGNYIIRTNKVILNGNIGLFPSSDKLVSNAVGDFLSSINVQRQPIVRLGVSKGPSSFLECVLLALNQPTGNVAEERFQLGNQPSTTMCAQEMWNVEITPKTLFQTLDLFLDPKLVIRQIEYIYKCNILLFYRTADHQGIIVPPHSQGFCSFERDNSLPSIFVYVHSGSETDMLEFPQCELICFSPDSKLDVKLTKIEKTWSWMEGTNAIYKSAWRAYDEKAQTWFGRIKYIPIPIRIVDLFSIQRQFIDVNGKVRLIELEYKGKLFIVETSPLPPFNLPLLPVPRADFIPGQDILDFIEFFSLKRIQTHTIQNHPQRITAWEMNWNIQFTFYIDSPRSLLKQDSMYSQYIASSKLSRYLTNWVLFLFSNYIFEANVVEITSRDIETFVSQWMTVDSNFQYDVDRVSEFLVPEQATGILRGGKLVCSSLELLKRLVYQLRLLIERDRTNVSEFRLKQTMDSFYQFSFDFYSFPNELLFYKPESVSDTLFELIDVPVHKVYSGLQANLNSPYFIRHSELTDTEIALTQNTQTVGEAYSKMVIWLNDGYNKPKTILYEELPYYLFGTRRTETKVFTVGGDPSNGDRRIAFDVETKTLGPILFL